MYRNRITRTATFRDVFTCLCRFNGNVWIFWKVSRCVCHVWSDENQTPDDCFIIGWYSLFLFIISLSHIVLQLRKSLCCENVLHCAIVNVRSSIKLDTFTFLHELYLLVACTLDPAHLSSDGFAALPVSRFPFVSRSLWS